MSLYWVTCYGPASRRWTSDEPLRSFDHVESAIGDEIYWHQFDVFADSPDVALEQTMRALKGAGRFESFSVAASDTPRRRAVDWSVIGPSTLDHASRAVLEALRPGPKPEWILRADPQIPASAQDLSDLLGQLREDGYVEHLGPTGYWQLSERVRTAIGR